MKTKLFTLALAALTIGLLGSCKKEDPKVSVTGVTLDKTELTLTVGDPDVKLAATIAPENATDKTVSWSSDKTEFATVDNQGNVHAVAPGTANITVTTTDGNKTATCAVTVKAAKVSVTGVTLDKTELTLTVGDPDVKLTATVAPENATDKTVSWSSDKTEFATVDTEGNVHAVAPGTANITVTTTDGNKTATCAVTVKTALPAGALSGKFTVNAEGKQVHFSKGNLTYNVSTTTWAFYEHQYDCATGYDANLISLFTWGYDATKSIVPDGTGYVEGHTTDGETFSKSEDWGYVFGGESSVWRTLSKDEWTYLINKDNNETIRKGKFKYAVTVCEKANCLVLAPDDFTGTIEASYDATAWATAEAAGLVCLPAAGDRYGSNVYAVGVHSYYWSSTAYVSGYAYYVYFDSRSVNPVSRGSRLDGYSVRLITEVK